MKRAVISGFTGHLGQELARQLRQRGVEVIGLTRQHSAVSPASRGIVLKTLDGHTETLVDIFTATKPDAVFHLAGLSRREHLLSDVVPFVTANVVLGTQLMEAMKTTGCKHLVTAGSYLQHYGGEGYRALNLYAATKQALEDIAAFYVDAYGLSMMRLTLCDIYSEHDTRPKLMTEIANAWRESRPVMVRDENALVDLIHVEDAATAFIHAVTLMEEDALLAGSLSRYSVSGGTDISARQLVKLCERVGGRELPINKGQTPTEIRRVKPWRGASMPGWQPRISLEDGIARVLALQP